MTIRPLEKSRVAIYGSKSFAHLLFSILTDDLDIIPVCFIDDFHEAPHSDIPILNLDNAMAKFGTETEILIGIGYDNLISRKNVIDNLKKRKIKLFSLIHPTAYISKSAHIGEGVIIMQKACISQNTRVGDGVVIWQCANISHDSIIEENCFLSPGSTLCGFSQIGHSTFIGANSTIVDQAIVPPQSFIKAGSVFKERK